MDIFVAEWNELNRLATHDTITIQIRWSLINQDKTSEKSGYYNVAILEFLEDNRHVIVWVHIGGTVGFPFNQRPRSIDRLRTRMDVRFGTA